MKELWFHRRLEIKIDTFCPDNNRVECHVEDNYHPALRWTGDRREAREHILSMVDEFFKGGVFSGAKLDDEGRERGV